MFDLGWSEMLIIAVVAIIVVGPKDLPGMLRNIGKFVGQAKRMANEFTGQFQEALRDSELEDLKKEFNEVTKVDPLSDFENSINKDLNEIDRDLKDTLDDYDRADAAENAAFESEQATNYDAANENDADIEDDAIEAADGVSDAPHEDAPVAAVKAAAGDKTGA